MGLGAGVGAGAGAGAGAGVGAGDLKHSAMGSRRVRILFKVSKEAPAFILLEMSKSKFAIKEKPSLIPALLSFERLPRISKSRSISIALIALALPRKNRPTSVSSMRLSLVRLSDIPTREVLIATLSDSNIIESFSLMLALLAGGTGGSTTGGRGTRTSKSLLPTGLLKKSVGLPVKEGATGEFNSERMSEPRASPPDCTGLVDPVARVCAKLLTRNISVPRILIPRSSVSA